MTRGFHIYAAVGIVVLLALVVVGIPLIDSADADASGERVDIINTTDADETIDVIVRFEDPDADSVAERQDAAENQHDAFKNWADAREGVEVKQTFWITSAALVELDPDEVPPQSLLNRPYAEEVHENIKFTTDASVANHQNTTAQDISGDDGQGFTYGLEQIDAPAAWDAHDARGDGVTIAVLDTGVHIDHEAIDLYTDDPDDPTYPGGWADFDQEGNQLGTEPYDEDGHGTHVTGTVGGNVDDTDRAHIGVAPDADLMHGNVFFEHETDEGEEEWVGSWAALISGIEWSVDNDADVITMSLGGDNETEDALVDPIENARDHGISLVASAGNDYEGTFSTPGAEWSTISVGMTDHNEDIHSQSSGGHVTPDEWDSPPEYWPDDWFVPTVAAPGVSVESALSPDSDDTDSADEYGLKSGTSMAAPHVAGAIAAIQSGTAETHRNTDIRDALEATAEKPDDWDEEDAEWHDDERDSRYGYGIINITAAINYLESDGEGATITDTELTDEPIKDITTPVNVTIENADDEPVEKDITLYIDDTIEYETTETVDPGEHTFTYYTTFDDTGDHDVRTNTQPAQTVTVVLDETTTVDTPDDGTYVNDDPITTTGSVSSDYVDIASVELTVDGDTYHADVDNDDEIWVVDNIDLEEGEYTATVEAENDHGHTATDTVSFTVDRTPPEVTFDDPTEADPAAATTGDTVEVTLSHDEDNLEEVVVGLVNNDDDTMSIESVDNPADQFTVTLELDDDYDHVDGETYDISVSATDEAGNSQTLTEANAVIVDHAPPDIIDLDLSDEYVQPEADITVTVDTYYAGVIEEVTADDTTLTETDTEGVYEGTITAADEEGEHSIDVTVTPEGDEGPVTDTVEYTVDDTPPTIDDTDFPDAVEEGTDYTAAVTASDDSSGVASVTVDGTTFTHDSGDTWTGTATAPDEAGDHDVTLVVEDTAGNQHTETVTIEVQPSIDLAADDPGDYTNEETVTITGTVDDHDTPVEVTVDSPAETVTDTITEGDSFAIDVAINDGENDIHVAVEDDKDTTDTQTVTITRDTDDPTVDLDNLPETVDSETDTVTVTGTATDDQSGLDTATLSVNGEQVATVEDSFDVDVALDYGENTITLHATDNAGNTAETQTTVEREKPDLTVTLDDLPDETANETITISGDVDGAVDGATIDITTDADSDTRTIDEETGTFAADLDLDEGENTITVTVTDGDDRTTDTTDTVVSDRTPPTIHDVTAPDSVAQGDEYTVTVEVTDAETGVDRVTADGTTLTHDSGDTWTGTLTAPDESGDHTITVAAEDGVGNENTTTTTVYVEKDLTLDVEDAPAETTDESITISGTVTDYYDPATVTIDAENDTIEQTLTDSETEFSETIDLEEGENTITITVTDEEGQTATDTLTVEHEADDDDDDSGSGGWSGGTGSGGDGSDDDDESDDEEADDEDESEDDEADDEDESEDDEADDEDESDDDENGDSGETGDGEDGDESDDETEEEPATTTTADEYTGLSNTPIVGNFLQQFEFMFGEQGDLIGIGRR